MDYDKPSCHTESDTASVNQERELSCDDQDALLPIIFEEIGKFNQFRNNRVAISCYLTYIKVLLLVHMDGESMGIIDNDI